MLRRKIQGQSTKEKDIRGIQCSSAELVDKKETTKKLLAKGQIRLLRWRRNVSFSRPDRKQLYLALCQKETRKQSKALYALLEKGEKGGENSSTSAWLSHLPSHLMKKDSLHVAEALGWYRKGSSALQIAPFKFHGESHISHLMQFPCLTELSHCCSFSLSTWIENWAITLKLLSLRLHRLLHTKH